MRLVAVFTNTYPALSHTFIRREIHALEKLGWRVSRLALRSGSPLVDPLDREEFSKTYHLLSHRRLQNAFRGFAWVCARPQNTTRSLVFILVYGRRHRISLLKCFAYFMIALCLAQHCRRHGIDLIRAHLGGADALLVRLSKRLGGPEYVIAYHGPEEFDSVSKWDHAGAVKESEFVSAISQNCKAQLCRWVDEADWHKIHLVRCGVNAESFHYHEYTESHSRRICIVARLEPRKGTQTLLHALRSLRGRGIDI